VTWLVFLSVWSSLVETVGRRARRPFHTLGDEHDKGAPKTGLYPLSVRRYARHTSTRTIDTVYLKLHDEVGRQVADAIDELVRASLTRETDH
jgi:hypothetical protein